MPSYQCANVSTVPAGAGRAGALPTPPIVDEPLCVTVVRDEIPGIPGPTTAVPSEFQSRPSMLMLPSVVTGAREVIAARRSNTWTLAAGTRCTIASHARAAL